MTLVIGTAFGDHGGALISDTRVTFESGQSRDMIRKAYPVGNYIAVGFAGSVRIGFSMVHNLKLNLQTPAEAASDIWEPMSVAREWSHIAKAIFEGAPIAEQRLGSRVLMVGIDPKGSGARLIRFASPEFAPQFVRKGLRTCSIGSGTADRGYMRVVRAHADIKASPVKLLQGGMNFWAGDLANGIGQEVLNNPRSDVGRHFHVLTVEHRGFSLHTSSRSTFVDWHDGPINLDPMPDVATGFAQFCEIAREEGLSASAAKC